LKEWLYLGFTAAFLLVIELKKLIEQQGSFIDFIIR